MKRRIIHKRTRLFGMAYQVQQWRGVWRVGWWRATHLCLSLDDALDIVGWLERRPPICRKCKGSGKVWQRIKWRQYLVDCPSCMDKPRVSVIDHTAM